MKFKYCPDCGDRLGETEIIEEGMVPFCKRCQRVHFEIFPVAAIALVYDENNDVLLLKQDYISAKYHNLLSGYMKEGESAEQTIVREIKEEVGLTVQELTLKGTYWYEQKKMLMVGFFARVKHATPVLSQEVDDAKWVKAQDAPSLLRPLKSGSISALLAHEFLKMIR